MPKPLAKDELSFSELIEFADDDEIDITVVRMMVGGRGGRPVDRGTVYRLIKRGLLPPPHRPYGMRAARWFYGEVRAARTAEAA